MYIGAHVSVAKGYAAAARETVEMGGNTFQFFSRNPRGSGIKKYQEADIPEFQAIRKKYTFGPVCAHAPYTMNLAAKDEHVYEFAKMVIREDIKRMDELGIECLCLHPGSHVGTGAKEGIKKITAALNEAITGKENICILLETMSGKGTEIGYTFEELRQIMDGIEKKEKIGVCFDLCHTFSAGYDIVNNLQAVLDEFDSVLSLERMKVVHLNDSMTAFGDKKDRHKPIGEGMIGKEAVREFISHPSMAGKPFILETPLEKDGHTAEIDMVKKLLNSQ